ncbi:hypothetical protein EDB81DRAFT_862555 [Dactylonectria macrodidyma]|uniref:Uncharacterized protein n=1 Tax=Dactylonectria macrodidyma TaxID=307937 RepID=A0A9P9D6N4_9HYPO|nr:hypothetical protein EDB81DRAFT_862555 [Dactylonectria macrodidyma]
MPVTIRGGVVQLTPVAITSMTATRSYFNSPPSALASVQTGLAILHSSSSPFRGANRPNPTRTSILPHHHYQPQISRPVSAMDEKDRMPAMTTEDENPSVEGFRDEKALAKKLVIDPNWTNPAFGGGDSMPRPLMARPPPAPPLTPPELSTSVFTFEDRPRPGDDSFMRQPNPDYMSSTMGSILPSSVSSPSIPRRRSYKKTLPIGVPVPQTSSRASDPADLAFSPSSYPPTSPLLPPAPPTAGALEIDVRGEIIGVLDGGGAGWTRHTRVYGVGVCLACEASGGNHGGGFYGATARPKEMR